MIETEKKKIRFIDSQYNTLFIIEDDGNIVITHPDGEKFIRPCKYLDEYHVQVGNNTYHICEFAEIMQHNGSTYAPEASEPTQEQLLETFLNNSSDAFAIFQLKDSDELRDIRFESMSRLESMGHSVKRKDYNFIYTDKLPAQGSTSSKLENLFYQFNHDRPEGFNGHSLSVSDVVVLKQNGKISCHYVDSFGFQKLPNFIERPEKCKPERERNKKAHDPVR